MSNICQTYVKHMPNICRTYVEHMSNMCQTYVENTYPHVGQFRAAQILKKCKNVDRVFPLIFRMFPHVSAYVPHISRSWSTILASGKRICSAVCMFSAFVSVYYRAFLSALFQHFFIPQHDSSFPYFWH
jgi:hypothetical protein